MSAITQCVIGEKTFKNILIGPCKLPGLSEKRVPRFINYFSSFAELFYSSLGTSVKELNKRNQGQLFSPRILSSRLPLTYMYRIHVTNLNYSSVYRALIIGGCSSFSMILYYKYNSILFSDGFISDLKGTLFVLRTKEN